MDTSEFSVLKIYASSTDKIGMKLLHEYIVQLARETGIAGATVFRGVMGYGQSSKTISSSKFWELTEKLPLVVELIDKTELLNAFYRSVESDLKDMKKGCLVTIEPVDVLMLKPGL